jgi:hypothetical protein
MRVDIFLPDLASILLARPPLLELLPPPPDPVELPAEVELPLSAEEAGELLLPAEEDELPAAEDELPAAEDELPAAEDELPAAEDELPAAEDELPAAEDELPAAGEVLLLLLLLPPVLFVAEVALPPAAVELAPEGRLIT